MRNTQLSITISLLLLCTLTNSCKKENDPCAGITQANAEFQIQTAITTYISPKDYTWRSVSVMYGGGKVRFDLQDKTCDSVWWKIGDDPRVFRERTVELNIVQELDIEVVCVVYNSLSASCLNNNGYDTVTKTLKILPEIQSPTRGKFRGYFDNDPNKELKEFVIDTGGFIKGSLYMLGFTDTSCDYSSFYGKDTRFLTDNSFVHDHQLSFITLIGGLHNMNKCDCVNQTGFADPDFESQMPTIYWEDDFNKLKVKLWQRVEPTHNSPFKEVWFYGERVQ